MGKRKRAKPPPKKAKPKVATVFDCPFCGAKDACGVRMDFDHAVGTIRCDACKADDQMRITRLDEPIDVYSNWIDKCEQVNKPGASRPVNNVRGGELGEEEEEEEGA